MENINITLILAQMINFGIIFLLFKKFVADKLNITIQKRRALLEKLENSKKEYAQIVEKAHKEKDEILSDAKKDANKLFAEIESLAKTNKSNIISEAERKAELILQKAQKEIENEKRSMLQEVKSHVVDLTLRLNKKLFKDDTKSREFMEKELNNI